MTRPGVLRRAGTPTRVGDLLLPTFLTLAGRDRAGAQRFLTRLRTPSPTPAVNP
ncbi:MAG: hypothetical protein QOI78_7021 [Actinomycetota bacterium]|nr:hypothetical protein [Actinomycetota bacterium]